MSKNRHGLHGAWLMILLFVGGLYAAPADLGVADAVKQRDKEALRTLLRQRADVNARQADGATALAWAAHWDDLETAELLIRAGADANVANDNGVTRSEERRVGKECRL